MKKSINIFLAALFVFIAVTSAFSTNSIPGPVSLKVEIRYLVNVHLETELPLCNTYWVEVLDENGNPVAPAKPYIMGVKSYSFYERGTVSGTRVAVLIRAPYDHTVCTQGLNTAPARLNGVFINGRTYNFDLYPQVQGHH